MQQWPGDTPPSLPARRAKSLVLVGGLAIALVVAIVVLGSAYVSSLFDESAYQMDLTGTTWRVVAIDGSPVPASVAPVLTFTANDITVETPCGRATSSYASDTDGSAISFETQPQADPSCEPEARRWHDALGPALGTTDEWDVTSQRAIRLIGSQTVELERVSSP
jgi:hypothetical protein